MKTRLFTPGPTPVPEPVMLRMAQPSIHHRTDEFRAVIRRVSDNLSYLFCTAQPVLTLTSSGTGAMEAAIVNTMSAGEELLFVNGGKFGERWGEIARAYGPGGEFLGLVTVEAGGRLRVQRLFVVGAGTQGSENS